MITVNRLIRTTNIINENTDNGVDQETLDKIHQAKVTLVLKNIDFLLKQTKGQTWQSIKTLL